MISESLRAEIMAVSRHISALEFAKLMMHLNMYEVLSKWGVVEGQSSPFRESGTATRLE